LIQYDEKPTPCTRTQRWPSRGRLGPFPRPLTIEMITIERSLQHWVTDFQTFCGSSFQGYLMSLRMLVHSTTRQARFAISV
jgi:hypothetical protein